MSGNHWPPNCSFGNNFLRFIINFPFLHDARSKRVYPRLNHVLAKEPFNSIWNCFGDIHSAVNIYCLGIARCLSFMLTLSALDHDQLLPSDLHQQPSSTITNHHCLHHLEINHDQPSTIEVPLSTTMSIMLPPWWTNECHGAWLGGHAQAVWESLICVPPVQWAWDSGHEFATGCGWWLIPVALIIDGYQVDSISSWWVVWNKVNGGMVDST